MHNVTRRAHSQVKVSNRLMEKVGNYTPLHSEALCIQSDGYKIHLGAQCSAYFHVVDEQKHQTESTTSVLYLMLQLRGALLRTE